MYETNTTEKLGGHERDLRARDPERWKRFIAKCGGLIIDHCRRRGLSHAAADEILSDVIFRLLERKWDTGNCNFRVYLTIVVNNAIIDKWRRRSTYQKHVDAMKWCGRFFRLSRSITNDTGAEDVENLEEYEKALDQALEMTKITRDEAEILLAYDRLHGSMAKYASNFEMTRCRFDRRRKALLEALETCFRS